MLLVWTQQILRNSGIPDNIGLNYVANITTPAFALVGEPFHLYPNNNGVNMYEGIANSQIIRVTDSDHCDYESPTDWGCESFCLNEATTLSDDNIRPLIKQLGTSAYTFNSTESNECASCLEF